jgi:hypothetical protein
LRGEHEFQLPVDDGADEIRLVVEVVVKLRLAAARRG